jgi:hypothetical protein
MGGGGLQCWSCARESERLEAGIRAGTIVGPELRGRLARLRGHGIAGQELRS